MRLVSRLASSLQLVIGCVLLATPCGAQSPTPAPSDPSEGVVPGVTAPANAAPAPGAPAPVEAVPTNIGNAVVKVFATLRQPDLERPWTKQSPTEITASGVVIDGKRILTNAHVVLYASQIQIQANQAGDKLSATVAAVAPGIDLAILKLDDDAFFSSHPPIARASKLPDIKDSVLAYGFPTGGNALSITKGIVSRIEFQAYRYPTSGLRIQIDAAINPGNSGGPAIAGDKMIGLAFSHLDRAQNIGYIIPNEEIDLFLKDIADGHYDGKPAIFDDLQTLENPAMRGHLKLESTVSGVVVHQPSVAPPSVLKEWDVITKIGGTPIDDQGMVKIGSDLRVSFSYLVQTQTHDGKVPLTIVRNGKTLEIQQPVVSTRPLMIRSLDGEYPSYFIYGPVVFSRATMEFIAGLRNSPNLMGLLTYFGSPLISRLGATPEPDREELVVISSPFFPHELAKGYNNARACVVRSVNGVKIRSLAHLVSVLRDLKDEFVVIEFDQRGGEALVFPRKALVAATDAILTDNGVRSQGSPDMMAVWNGKH